MKKIFSIVLATALLCGMLLPMAVSAEDPAAVAISATGETTIEFEAYASSFAVSGGELDANQSAGTFAKVLNKGQASKGQCLFFETGAYTNASTVLTKASIPVSVTEAGTYIIAIRSTSTGSGSKLKVVVDGTTYDRKSTASLGNIYENASFPGQDIFFEVPLTTSTEAITVQFGGANGKFLMMLDCMKVKLKTVDIAADGVTTIECEDYAKYFAVYGGELDAGQSAGTFAKVVNKGQASRGQILFFDTGAYTNMTTVLTKASIPVTVTEAGYYTLTIRSTSLGSGSKLKVVVDGTTYDRKSTASLGNIYENASFPGQDIFFEVPLTTNTKNITVQFGGTNGKFQMILDCIKLEIKPVDIAADGVTTVECEDYAKFFAVSGGELAAGQSAGIFAKAVGKGQASRGQCLFFDTGVYTNAYAPTLLTKASIPVSVTEAGTYIIAIRSTSLGSGGKLKVVVDGTTYERKSTASLGNIYENASFPGADIFFEVPLTTNTKNITVQFGGANGKFQIFLDCIKLKKSAETAISTTTGAATVKYTAAEGPSEAGIAVLALYKDDQLVSVEKWNVEPEVVLNEIVLSHTTEYDGDYDEAKVFVWKDFDKCLPLAVAKDLTIN